MRFFLAGILLLAMTVSALAQAKGEVEVIGFQNAYRPATWTPMLVRIRPETGASDYYQIQVVQEDLDNDRVVYSRLINLTGNVEGQAVKEQRFWMYFIPTPTRYGLPESTEGLRSLQDRVKVFLATAEGKQLVQLPITSTVSSLEPYMSSDFTYHRGKKLVLAVADPETGSAAVGLEYEKALGTSEQVVILNVAARDLPEDPIGYDAVDAIVWLNADARQLVQPTDEKMRAIRGWVRGGGQLVVTQPPEYHKTAAFADMLPVTVTRTSIAEKLDARPLANLARARWNDPSDPWHRVKGPFKLAKVEAKSGAVVDEWIQWKNNAGDGERTPYIARQAFGLGSVTWVAQDLGDPAITGKVRTGWPWVWDAVFDWKHDTFIENTPQAIERMGRNKQEADIPERYAMEYARDLGWSILPGMDHGARGTVLVMIAVLFFILYWVIAGPVAYVYLSSKKRPGLSWFAFAASAVVATLLTVLVVQVVLRGKPQLKHVTVVRTAPGQDAVAFSGLGLYIPSDGVQEIELQETGTEFVSYVIPYPMHPQHQSQASEFPAIMKYEVPVPDSAEDAPAAVEIPYRSTLKKLGAQWSGTMEGTIGGAGQLVPAKDGYITGSIVNNTPGDLRNVYVAFSYPAEAARGDMDWVLYIPNWRRGQTLDLAKEWAAAGIIGMTSGGDSRNEPGQNRPVRGFLANQPVPTGQWEEYWFQRYIGSFVSSRVDDWSDPIPRSFPLLSLYDRVPIFAKPSHNGNRYGNRFDLIRNGIVRDLNVSPAIAAGAMVVLAQSANDQAPLPYPLEVEGDAVRGEGRIYYQAVLPLNRTIVEEEPATRPATRPANAAERVANP